MGDSPMNVLKLSLFILSFVMSGCAQDDGVDSSQRDRSGDFTVVTDASGSPNPRGDAAVLVDTARGERGMPDISALEELNDAQGAGSIDASATPTEDTMTSGGRVDDANIEDTARGSQSDAQWEADSTAEDQDTASDAVSPPEAVSDVDSQDSFMTPDEGGTAAGQIVFAKGLPTALPASGSSGSLEWLANAPVSGFITDVNVTISISHTCTKDLSATLTSPSGTVISLFDMGSYPVCSSNMVNTEFDDEAFAGVTSGSKPFTGTFKPVGSLSLVDGESASGLWTLNLFDDTPGDSGTLDAWSLEIQAE